jgi:hypothetical protein
MIVIMIATLALQAVTPAQSDAKAPPAKTSQTADKSKTTDQDDPDKKICRRQTPVGSSIEQRVCKTKAQWDVEAAAAQTQLQDLTTRNGGASH